MSSLYIANLRLLVESGRNILRSIDSKMLAAAEEMLPPGERDVLTYSAKAMTRRFKLKEVADIVGVSTPTLRRAEEDGRIPAPQLKQDSAHRDIRDGWTYPQYLKILDAFGKRAARPADRRGIIMSFPNLKGGCWKTTLTVLMAQYLALKGYKVLLVDTDAQGGMSFFLGYRTDLEGGYDDTIAPYVLFDEETIIKRGGDPHSLRYAVRPTHWENIHMIPANLGLSNIDLSYPIALANAETGPERQEIISRLGDGLRDLAKDYDVVLVDGTPSLGILTISTVAACDRVVVPVPAQMADFASSLAFFSNLLSTAETLERGELTLQLPEYYVLVTKFATAQYSNWMSQLVRKAFGQVVLGNMARKTDEVGKSGAKVGTIYEQQYSDATNPKAFKAAVEMFDQVFNEIHERVILPFWSETADLPQLESPLSMVQATVQAGRELIAGKHEVK